MDPRPPERVAREQSGTAQHDAGRTRRITAAGIATRPAGGAASAGQEQSPRGSSHQRINKKRKSNERQVAAQAASIAAADHLPVSQVRADIVTQANAGPITTLLQNALGSDYAGVWFEDATGSFHVNVLTGADQAAAQAVIATRGIDAQTQYDTVRYSWRQLPASQAYWDAKLADLTAAGKASPSIDPRSDAVVLILGEREDEGRAGHRRGGDRPEIRHKRASGACR